MDLGLIVILIFLLNILLLFISTLKYPVVKIFNFELETYSITTLAGPLLLLAFGLITGNEALHFLQDTGKASPAGILVLFLSMVFMSIYLDNVGFMEFCAKLALKHSGNDGKKLFLIMYALVSVMTIFTSNDIIILTMTPFIYYFSKYAKINPLPLLLAEFFAANTWSMMFYIGNPTNIFVASAYDIRFLEYTKLMILPTVFAGMTSLLLLYILFKKDINVKFMKVDMDPFESLKDRRGAVVGVAFLFLCILGIAISPYFNLEMWPVSLVFAVLLGAIIIFRDLHNKKEYFKSSIYKMPWSVVPFLLSFFIMVGALSKYGLTDKVGLLISELVDNSVIGNIFVYGLGSAVSANLLNNIPMTITFTSILSGLSGSPLLFSALAVIIGSNLGANLTPIGALAGIMWMTILKNKKFKITFLEFMKYGLLVNILTLLVALGTLCLLI